MQVSKLRDDAVKGLYACLDTRKEHLGVSDEREGEGFLIYGPAASLAPSLVYVEKKVSSSAFRGSSQPDGSKHLADHTVFVCLHALLPGS